MVPSAWVWEVYTLVGGALTFSWIQMPTCMILADTYSPQLHGDRGADHSFIHADDIIYFNIHACQSHAFLMLNNAYYEAYVFIANIHMCSNSMWKYLITDFSMLISI